MSTDSDPRAPSASDPPAWALAPGCPRAGRFLIGPERGHGGMGRVHEAWDPLLRRRVALKRLAVRDPQHILRFMREANHQARVSHPAICPIHEVGTEGGEPYIVMRLVEGPPLSELRQDLPLRDLASLMAEVAGAVGAAHRAGLVHRDLKPQNILVEGEPGALRPWVVDFGLARDVARGDLTLTWACAGTPAFMSPEQARGAEPAPGDDLYSLGATLYAMLLGLPPYEATTVAGLVERQARGEAPPVRARRPDVPRDLETLVQTCIDPDPRRRYASAADLEADLRRFAAGGPIRARRVTPLDRLWRRILRHRKAAAAVAASLAVALGLLGWSLRVRAEAARQTEMATRFGLEAKGLEDLMRLERLMPPHDLRPAERRLQAGMGEIRKGMDALGRAAWGPGNYALGRIELALREDEAALGHLEAAWAAGFRTPECAYGLGTALARRFARRMVEVRLQDRSHTTVEAARRELMAQVGEKALAYFRLSRGQALDHPALGEAQIANLREEHGTCIAKCQEALRAAPWLSEARLLELQASRQRLSALDEATDTSARDRVIAEGDALAREALERAPSDSDLLGLALEDLTSRAIRESREGRPSDALFREGETLFARAMVLHPGDPGLVESYGRLRMRYGVHLGSHGGDPRPVYRETIALLERVPRIVSSDSLSLPLNWLFLAGAQAARGEDPRPALARARAGFPDQTPDIAEAGLVEARFLDARGQDPRPALRAALVAVDRLLGGAQVQAFYPLQIRGEILGHLARWEAAHGVDPAPTMAAAREATARSLAIKGGNVFALWDHALLEALEAERRAGRGEPWEAPWAAAQASARAAQEARADHFRSAWIVAEVWLARARILDRLGRDPEAALAEAARAARRGLGIHAASFELRLTLAEVRRRQGRPADAEREARAGLRAKPDAVALWRELARALDLQRRSPEEALARIRALNPGGQAEGQWTS
ncbi:serine/threonine-protein kinase [Mesoterricola sediminis]|uniref:Protein kinase domain-containing protein n=1 Tax=Mesoterricola sediminis TaxID=2927980 RepID=A0AA48HEN8_9BACT|nr:serine/threonine-protein kinase [Mesoterricola sediminis]BDU76863.1 hypothetical protein METESE_18210 [Mesoterricola sediminis]